MEAVMLSVKFLMFYVLEFAVVALVIALAISVLHEWLRSRARTMRREVGESRSLAPATVRKN